MLPSATGAISRLSSSIKSADKNDPLILPPPSSSSLRMPKNCAADEHPAKIDPILAPEQEGNRARDWRNAKVVIRYPLGQDGDHVGVVDRVRFPGELASRIYRDGIRLESWSAMKSFRPLCSRTDRRGTVVLPAYGSIDTRQ